MPKKKKKKKKKKGKADLTTVLHIRELPHLHMKLAVWFSFPITNNKNPMIPSWSLVSIYNYSFSPDQIFTKNFEILELEMCSQIFTCGMRFLQVNSSLPTSLKKNMCWAIKFCIVPVKKPFINERFDKFFYKYSLHSALIMTTKSCASQKGAREFVWV